MTGFKANGMWHRVEEATSLLTLHERKVFEVTVWCPPLCYLAHPRSSIDSVNFTSTYTDVVVLSLKSLSNELHSSF